jgi:hypothetical protein
MKSRLINVLIFFCVILLLTITSCDNNEPVKEDVPELITRVELTFSENSGGSTYGVEAIDPDGEGVQDLEVTSPVMLKPNTTYTLKIGMFNTLANPGDDGYDIGKEVVEEGKEHMIFFSWTKDVFSNPTGNGNIDSRSDQVIYNGASDSTDDDGLPLGFTTIWTTGQVTAGADFRVKLMHQPGLKSATSDASMGETDLDVTFTINVQ